MLVVTGVSVPEVPVMVIVADPVAAVEAAVNVITLVAVAGLVANAAVTPVGNPDAARVTLPVNPFSSVTAMVLVPVLPGATFSVEGEAARVKLGAPVTVSVMEVVTGVRVPEVPVMVIGYAPATVDAATANVTTLEVVEEVGLNVAVTPVGMPEAAKVTLPANGLTSVTVMVSVPLAPGATDRVAAEGLSVKLPLLVTVSETEVVALSVPEVPVMVIGYVPATVDAATANVTTLEVVEEAGLNAAVTPVGMPEAANVTLPANGLTSVTVMVSVPLAPGATDSVVAEGFSVKLPCPTPPQAVPLIAKFVGTALVVPFQVPLNPIPVRLPPAAILPL
jgi:hypothetical protein